MSSDHYAQHLIQKYRLAVAIGIIQTKPEAKSLDQHITDMRIKINDDKMDDMTICSDDFDMDFNEMADFDDHLDTSQHSDTILKDFNDVNVSGIEFGHTSRDNIFSNVFDLTEENGGRQVQTLNNENDIQSTFCETQAQSDTCIARESLTDVEKTFCDSIALINRGQIVAIDKACDNITKLDNMQTSIHKTTCKNVQKNQTLNTNNTYYDSLLNLNQNNTANIEKSLGQNVTNNSKRVNAKETTHVDIDRQHLDLTTAFDSQATELYTVNLTEDYTHVSQSQTNNFDISNRYIKGMRKNNDNEVMFDIKSIEDSLPLHIINTDFGNNIKDVNLVNKVKINIGKASNTIQEEKDNLVKNARTTTCFNMSNDEIVKDNLQENTEFGYNFKDINLVKKINMKLDNDLVTTAAMIENVEHFTQADLNEEIGNLQGSLTNTEFEYNFKDINLARKVSKNLNKDTFANIPMELDDNNLDLNNQADLNSSQFKINDCTQETQKPFVGENSEQILINPFKINNSQNTITEMHEISRISNDNMTMKIINLSQNDQHESRKNKNNSLTSNTVKNIFKTNVQSSENMTIQVFDLSQNVKAVENNKFTNPEMSRTNVQNSETMQVFDCSQNTQNPDYKKTKNDIENESVSSEEVSELVPFKVMEELNRVKAYLNRRIERRMSTESSLDSGYRSDSQGRSKSALQLSNNWIGQSAYCLYEHITQCPMVATTQQIVNEISQVLGQLIDRLHDEESYPAFLEQLLEHVDTLIRSIFTEEDMLLEKDEKIQRLFLLNKSIHIQKYSIEKLTVILENIHTNLTAKEELHELTNIQEVENLSYIFHILEVLIKRHLKIKKIDGSQTQSQEENYPKSSISDIWRRKWNPKYKEESKLDSSLDKKCVFTKCSEVLNKIVVGCLDGYSLVAYAALQCFNLLQG